MSDDRYETIVERLAAIEEELRDLAYDRLTVVARARRGTAMCDTVPVVCGGLNRLATRT